jgi:hypothetical protein
MKIEAQGTRSFPLFRKSVPQEISALSLKSAGRLANCKANKLEEIP